MSCPEREGVEGGRAGHGECGGCLFTSDCYQNQTTAVWHLGLSVVRLSIKLFFLSFLLRFVHLYALSLGQNYLCILLQVKGGRRREKRQTLLWAYRFLAFGEMTGSLETLLAGKVGEKISIWAEQAIILFD